MADDGKTRDRTAGSRKKSSEDRPFDLWLQKQLHAMYDEIAREPLPDELLGLIDRDAATGAATSGDAKPAPPREPRNKK